MSFFKNTIEKAKSFLGAKPVVGVAIDSVTHDRYDAMLWRELLDEVPPLQDLVTELNEKHSYTEDMVRDALMQFWQSDPQLRKQGEMDTRYLTNHAVSVDIEKAPETVETRAYTQHDKYGSAMATIAVGSKVREFLKKNKELEDEQEKANEAQQQAEQDAQAAQQAADEADKAAGDYDGEGPLTAAQQAALDAMLQAMADAQASQGAAQMAAQACQQAADGAQQAMRAEIRDAVKEVGDDLADEAEMMAAWGVNSGELQQMDFQARASLAQMLRSNRLNAFRALIGRFRTMAAAQRSRKVDFARDEVYSTEMSDRLPDVIGSEFAHLANKHMRLGFLQRLAEGQLLSRKYRGTEKIGQGAIIFLCADEATEILTASGWRRYDRINVGDQVMTLNHVTGLSEWQPLSAVHIYGAQPRTMLHVRGKRHDSLTTLDHRWPVLSTVRSKGVRTKVRNWKVSSTLSSEDSIIAAAPCVNLPTEAKYQDALVELVAWTWAEGTILPPGNAVRIYQSHKVNPAYCAKIRAALTSLLGPATLDDMRKSRSTPLWRETLDENTGMTSFALNRLASEAILEHMDPDRVVSPAFILALTSAQLGLFINTSIDGDGTRGNVDSFSQKLEARNRIFELACACLGLPTNTAEYAQPNPWNGVLTPTFRTSILNRDHASLSGVKRELVQYDGIVWCPSVPNTTWLARRNGKVFYTGNCDNSGSMGATDKNGLTREAWAKAFMLSMLDSARAANRDFVGINFASANQQKVWRFPAGKCDVRDVVEMTEHFFNGNTDYERPLNLAMDILEKEFNDTGKAKADLVMCTDDDCRVSPEWQKQYLARKARLGFRTFGIGVGMASVGGALDALSDNVRSVTDFADPGSVADIVRVV